jgi:hypothetical protein
MPRRRTVNITGKVDTTPPASLPEVNDEREAEAPAANEPVATPEPSVPDPEPAPLVVQPIVDRIPDVAGLRAAYDALAAEVKTLKPGSEAFKTAMEAKRQAFIAWNNVAVP